ncbi:MAG: hypothetical protein QOI48_2769 [Solirubrobacteraceae bacterium]|jgi:hypothetical protein|nr:hypothetical protein [Solirubrobacteraceae bacterium]
MLESYLARTTGAGPHRDPPSAEIRSEPALSEATAQIVFDVGARIRELVNRHANMVVAGRGVDVTRVTVRWILIAGVLLAAVVATPAMASSGQQACVGAPIDQPAGSYNETRQFVDFQSWWKTTPGKAGTDFGHVHVGACIPEREQMVGATIPLDVRLVLHDNPAKKTNQYPGLSIVVKGKSQETTIAKQNYPGWTCPVGTCTKWFHYDLPQSAFDDSGLQEIRFRFFVDEPDGSRMIASANWQTYINNGKAEGDVTRQPYLRAKGWYSGAGYCEASFRSALPDGPVPAIWSATVAQVWHGTSADLPVSGFDNRFDADNHAAIAGTVLNVGSGPFGPAALNVPAGSLLAGTHKLNMRADCADPRGSTNSGVLVLPFRVAGG